MNKTLASTQAPSRSMLDQTFTCPHCWERITVRVDPSVPQQTYIRDCDVCCRPIRIHYRVRSGQVVAFNATPTQ
jgi:transcription elongation factor Elf1